MTHIPVLQKEVIQYIDPKPNENFIDATIGGGGHALEILKRIGPSGKLMGIDLDESAIEKLKLKAAGQEAEKRLILACDNFTNLEKIVRENNFGPVQGILADLGMSSGQLEESGRGFSFLKDEPLIMAYNKSQIADGLTAAGILSVKNKEELEKIFKEYGEERFARQIARKIVESRRIKPIRTTLELVNIIKSATPFWYHRLYLHPATRIFQALRIAVNDELNNLISFLPQALNVLVSGGRLIVISFHSLEDRIVKNLFKEKKQLGLIKILTKKVIKPTREETGINPRSRSAKLRAAVKL